MTTRVLTGTYASGYLLRGPVTSLTVADGAYVAGHGIDTSKASRVAYSIVNEGRIKSVGFGIYLRAGGHVSNAAPSSIVQSAYTGIAINGGAGYVVNGGLIQSTGGPKYLAAAVDLVEGGTVSNGGASDTAASITGEAGVLAQVGYGIVENYGTIIGTGSQLFLDAGVYLESGGRVTNGSSTSVAAFVQGYHAINITGSAGYVTNFGTLEGQDGNPYQGAVRLGDGGVVKNYGVIRLPETNGLGGGVALYRGGVVINGGVTDTAALIQGGNGVYSLISPALVRNFATIVGGMTLRGGGEIVNGAGTDTIADLAGSVRIEAMPATVVNFGRLQDGVDTLGAIVLTAGGLVVNGAATDRSARIDSYGTRIEIEGGSGTVANFGAIYTAGGRPNGTGVVLKMGGKIINGSAVDENALISGMSGGVIYGGAGLIRNYGTIDGSGPGGSGAEVLGGGALINGSSSDTGAAIIDSGSGGYAAVVASGSCLNFGTIQSAPGAYSVHILGGHLINGAANDATALIKGWGVSLGSHSTITNFGTIAGPSAHAVIAKDATDAVIVEAGSTFLGAVVGGGGLLNLASGSGTLSGISNGAVHVSGSMPPAAFKDFGTLEIGTAARFSVVGAVQIVTGDRLIDAGSMAMGGGIHNSGMIALLGSAGALEITTHTDLTGGGTLLVGTAPGDRIYGASTGTILVNTDNLIHGAGQLGAASLEVTNEVNGIIEGDIAGGLIIDVGANTIINAGLIIAKGFGSISIRSAIANGGRLEAVGGGIAVDGPVSGDGLAAIDGGSITFLGGFDEKVSFLGSGLLGLAQSQGYGGAISGFSSTGATALDLRDVGFVGAGEATFNGAAGGGVLTVTDGAHTARIRLLGDYLTATFTAKSDGDGGTVVTASSTMTSGAHFIAAAAGIGASPPHTLTSIREPWTCTPTPFAPLVALGGSHAVR